MCLGSQKDIHVYSTISTYFVLPVRYCTVKVIFSVKGLFTLSDSDSESEKDQRTARKDQSVGGKTSKKSFAFAIVQCKWALTVYPVQRSILSVKSVRLNLANFHVQNLSQYVLMLCFNYLTR